MEPENIEVEGHLAPLKKVTPLSKYLALALFIIMPFIGGWIGYTWAPEKVVEKIVVREMEVPVTVANVSEPEDYVVIEQPMWASRVKIYNDNRITVLPYIDFQSGVTMTNVDFPSDWTISYSEQTSPEQSKTIRFADPDLPGKPDTDAVGAHVRLAFIRADSCEDTFIYKNNVDYLTFDEQLSSPEIKMYASDWVTNRTMGSVPSKDVCIENTGEYHDVIIMTLHPLTDENKSILDDVIKSVRN